MVFIQRQYAGLKVALGVAVLLVGHPVLQAGVGIDNDLHPVPLGTSTSNFVMGITYGFKIQPPVFPGHIRQALGFAGDGVYFTSGCTNLVDDSLLHVAP